MKISNSKVIVANLFALSTVAGTNTGANIGLFEKQKEEVQATFNIERNDEKNGKNLRDSDLVDVLIKTNNKRRGASTVMAMSLNVGMQIESAGIIGATVTKKDMDSLAQNPDIESIEIDYPQYVLEDPTSHIRKLSEETPYGIPMVLEDVDFWKNLGEPSGTIKVCVADTGYGYGHVDLPQGSDVTGTDNPYNGSWDTDGHGHGTHCSGTVAGIGGNNEGVVGVIPNNAGGKFQLVIGKALSDSGSGSNSGVLKAVELCVNDGAKVISLSLGGGAPTSIAENFFKDLYENQDILFVAAAGNDGNSVLSYPASYPALISVAAIDSNKNKAGFSQYNDQVELSGPGVYVKSTLPGNSYASWSGTSMATPHVAGVAGLLWMHFPECKNYQIRNVLAVTAEDLGANGCDNNYGHGLVQAKKAYDLLSQGNCGGLLGQVSPVGGCDQLDPTPVLPTSAPVSSPVQPGACPPSFTGFIPTSGCKGYLVCQNGSLTSEHDCGEGQLFDVNMRACMLEQFVTCESSPTEAPVTTPPTNAPVTPPTNVPTTPPTNAPITPPTSAPVTPTLPPVSPTVAPIPVTPAPVLPTSAPVSSPVQPGACPPSFTGFIPTSGCKGYLVCQNGSLTSEHDCGEGKLFDANMRACNLEQFVTCESSPTDSPVSPPTDSPVSPPTEAPVSPPTEAPVSPPTNSPVTPTQSPVQVVECPSGYTGLIKNNECTAFYHCHYGELISEVPIECSDGLLYNSDELCMCNFVFVL